MNYRAIALDLDGTLLTSDKTILNESLSALARAQQAGYRVIITTGRHHIATRPFQQMLALTTPAICCNGSYLYDFQQEKVLQGNPISQQQAQQTLALLAQFQLQGFMYVDSAMLYQQPTTLVQRMLRWREGLAAHLQPDIRQVASLAEAAAQATNIWKFALTDSDNTRLQQFAAAVSSQLALECEWSLQDQLDVAQQGNNKGRRLAQWAASEGISMSEIVAFGDNHNDISMLKNAGLGVAMGNAESAVKASARLVTTSHNDPGIASIIEQYLL